MTMTDIEVLKMDGCTKSEAEKHLLNGTIVFEDADFEKNLESYLDEWEVEEEERAEYRKMVSEKKPLTDWGIVENSERAYYIMYVL